jgi:hypothetical protein
MFMLHSLVRGISSSFLWLLLPEDVSSVSLYPFPSSSSSIVLLTFLPHLSLPLIDGQDIWEGILWGIYCMCDTMPDSSFFLVTRSLLVSCHPPSKYCSFIPRPDPELDG